MATIQEIVDSANVESILISQGRYLYNTLKP
jgi:hypothetical protein